VKGEELLLVVGGPQLNFY